MRCCPNQHPVGPKINTWSRSHLSGCFDSLCLVPAQHVEGTFSPSQDHKTYLAVVDDNGGQCGPIKVDGKLWPYHIGEAGPIDPGPHTIVWRRNRL